MELTLDALEKGLAAAQAKHKTNLDTYNALRASRPTGDEKLRAANKAASESANELAGWQRAVNSFKQRPVAAPAAENVQEN